MAQERRRQMVLEVGYQQRRIGRHYFFYSLYYDFCADTEAERERVREVVRDVTDHLLTHGFVLIDHDGKPTRWPSMDAVSQPRPLVVAGARLKSLASLATWRSLNT